MPVPNKSNLFSLVLMFKVHYYVINGIGAVPRNSQLDSAR